jgi:hypothetical protein
MPLRGATGDPITGARKAHSHHTQARTSLELAVADEDGVWVPVAVSELEGVPVLLGVDVCKREAPRPRRMEGVRAEGVRLPLSSRNKVERRRRSLASFPESLRHNTCHASAQLAGMYATQREISQRPNSWTRSKPATNALAAFRHDSPR